MDPSTSLTMELATASVRDDANSFGVEFFLFYQHYFLILEQ